MKSSDTKLFRIATFSIGAVLLAHCSPNEAPPSRNTKASTGDGQGVPASPSPTENPTATPPAESGGDCEAQWKQHVAYFTAGRQLNYTSNVTVFGQAVPVAHTESVTSSSDAEVSRKVSLSSTNSVATSILSKLKIPDPVTVKKSDFISLCNSASGSAQPSVTFGSSSATIVESRKESVTLASGGAVQAQYALVTTNIVINSQPSPVKAKIWSSLKNPGLVLKQIIDLSNVPLASQATLTEELATPE